MTVDYIPGGRRVGMDWTLALPISSSYPIADSSLLYNDLNFGTTKTQELLGPYAIIASWEWHHQTMGKADTLKHYKFEIAHIIGAHAGPATSQYQTPHFAIFQLKTMRSLQESLV